jgi:hypothetical protein
VLATVVLVTGVVVVVPELPVVVDVVAPEAEVVLVVAMMVVVDFAGPPELVR